MTTIPCPLDAAAKAHPHATALLGEGFTMDYATLHHWVDEIVEALRASGLQRGDRLLVYSHRAPGQIALFLACLRAGITFVPISTRNHPRQHKLLAAQTQAKACVTAPSLAAPLTEEPLLRIDARPWWTGPNNPNATSPTGDNFLDAEGEATVIQTSGSTHQPKAAVHWLKNHYYSALGSNQNIRLERGDRWLLSLPMFHVAGIAIVMRSLLAGATIALPNQNENLERSLQRLQPTHISMVSTQLARLLEHTDNLPRLQQTKAILLGGSAIPKQLRTKSAQHKLPLFISYGSTEMSSQICTTPAGGTLKDWETCGKLLPYRELRITKEGEIQVRGEVRFAGYLHEGRLESPFDAEGWFNTGDLGTWDEDGNLQVFGRKDAMFISGGENIQPEEIERALERHEDVERAMVVDIPHSEYGARPCAFVKMRAGVVLQSRQLRAFLADYLPRFKIPDRFYNWPVDDAPNGIKWSRAHLRKLAHKS